VCQWQPTNFVTLESSTEQMAKDRRQWYEEQGIEGYLKEEKRKMEAE